MQVAHKQPSCADLVQVKCDSRLSALRDMFDVYTGRQPAHDDITEDSFHEYGLSFDYVAPGTFDDQDEGYWRYQISWGGPSDEIRFYASPSATKGRGWHMHRAEYWYMDWFDGACVVLTGEQRDTAREVFEWFDEIDAVTCEIDKARE